MNNDHEQKSLFIYIIYIYIYIKIIIQNLVAHLFTKKKKKTIKCT